MDHYEHMILKLVHKNDENIDIIVLSRIIFTAKIELFEKLRKYQHLYNDFDYSIIFSYIYLLKTSSLY